MLGENLFPTSSGMDTNHSHTNGPRGISNGHLKISIISLKKKSLRRDQKSQYYIGPNFYFKYFTALCDVIFTDLLGMLKILLFPYSNKRN